MDCGDWRWLGQRKGVGDCGITESPRLEETLGIIQSNPSSTTKGTLGRAEQELGTSTGSRSPPLPGLGISVPGWPGRLRSCQCADVGALQHQNLPPVQNPGKVGWSWSRGVPSPGQGRGRIRGIAAREAPGTRPQRLPKLPRGRAEPPERLSQPGAAAAEEKRGSLVKTGKCTWIFRDAPTRVGFRAAPPGVFYRCRFSPRCSIPGCRDPCVCDPGPDIPGLPPALGSVCSLSLFSLKFQSLDTRG